MELNLQPPSLRVTDDFRNPHFRLKLIDSETDVLVCLKHFRELCSKLLNPTADYDLYASDKDPQRQQQTSQTFASFFCDFCTV